jgi:outer membrane receptor protein involved in Fe transport
MLINTEDLDIVGIEGMIEGHLDKTVRGGASWAFSDATSEILGPDPLDFFPRHRGTAWLGANTARGGLTARVQYFGTQIDRSTELPARTLVQLTAHARLYENYRLNLRAENVSGRVYEQRVGVRAPGRTAFLSLQGDWR